ncbi:MAG: acyl-CoA dehydrogenase [candidate division NC10 bacterium RIFCSPLOWO2_12_FULL_66_18]|nr:MAG: acyl-CoA dehydrogenase [candidate division NC10 bacterium RIFCSPLOWO2_12_FULL_66_18]
MDFQLTEAQRLIRDTVREFAEKELAPLAAELDRLKRYPEKPLQRLAELGVLGMTMPPEYGGAGADTVSSCLALMEISRACASTGVTVSLHNTLTCEIIYRHGTEDQRQRYLPALCRGELLGAFSLTEPTSGSDAASLRTTAIRRGDRYVLNGTKQFVTNGSRAGAIILFASTDPPRGEKGITAFLIEPLFPGFRVGKREDKMGLRASDTTELVLEDCQVPVENRIGEEGEGFKIALSSLVTGRAGIAAQAVGIAQACLDASIRYAKERRQFGQPIAEFQAIQWKLANMATETEAARLLTLRAAARKDRGLPCTMEASMAKLFASEAANRSAAEAVQIHGGYGYLQDFPVERYMRDARVLTIYEGTSEIHRLIVARQLLSPSPQPSPPV